MENEKKKPAKKDCDLFEQAAQITKPASIDLPPLPNTGAEKAEQCETIQELNKTAKEQNETVQETLDKEFKIEIPAYKTPNLVAAINQVMREVKGIEKTANVGSGNNAFKAVSDKDVKRLVGQAMERAGLAILPISVEPLATVERWEVSEQWGNKPEQMKRKKEVFTEVRTKYLLMHESGQQIELAGYGQGVDNMDKSAGKATTYALKYALLYTFLIPTGDIDDADKTQPPATPKPKQTLTDSQFAKAIAAIEVGTYTKAELEDEFALSKIQEEQLTKIK